MNKLTRMLAMTGMALAASATMGVSPASASPAEATAPSVHKAASHSADIRLQPGRTRIIGYFRSPLACHRVGRIGEFHDRWDDHDCYRVRGGFHRGSWVLVVRWDRHGWPGHGGGPGWPGHGGGDGPGWPGHGDGDGPGWPGHGDGDGPGHGQGQGHGPGQGPWNR